MSPSEPANAASFDRLQPYLFLLPIIAVALVFSGINAPRDDAQLRSDVVTFYIATAKAPPPLAQHVAGQVEREALPASRRTP